MVGRFLLIWAGALALAGCRMCSRPPATSTPVADSAATAAPAGHDCRCGPGQPCWPSAADWEGLRAQLAGRLEQPKAPLEACRSDLGSVACGKALAEASEPFTLQDQSGATQSSGWLNAWTSQPSAYAVVAEGAADVAAAVRFAAAHRLRLVIKGTGHDYLGRSSAPGSLLVWTHEMRAIRTDYTFVPSGCPEGEAPVEAVSVEAGARWGEVYRAVSVEHGLYVQGGGCTSVGAVGGFLQGGGFGSFSKMYGTAAANLIEAEVVTADGELRIANRCQNQDLYWALRGGGGGTFGVVTRATLRTHPLPRTFGAVVGTIKAKDDPAFQALLLAFLEHYRDHLSNPHWGEQVVVQADNSLQVRMVFADLSEEKAHLAWAPFQAWLAAHAEAYTADLSFLLVPAGKLWDVAYLKANAPQLIRPAQGDEQLFIWASDQEQVSAFWYGYQSRWLPADRLAPEQAADFAKVLYQASRVWPVALHFQKGQAGADPEAIARGRETASHPALFDAAALIIVSGHAGQLSFVGVPGHEPDQEKGQQAKARIDQAMRLIREVTPDAGSYLNETDYFEPNWQSSFWGAHYPRLLSIKEKYDPKGLFYCHHCVGSEPWTDDGMCRR